MQKLGAGILDIFESFPEWKVADYMQKYFMIRIRENEYEVTDDIMDNLYFHYKTGVEKGVIPWYDADKFDWENNPVRDYLAQQTNFSEQLITDFLWTLDVMVRQGELKPVFLQIERPESHPVETAKTSVKEFGEEQKKLLNKMMWIMGGVVILLIGIKAGPAIYKVTTKKRKK